MVDEVCSLDGQDCLTIVRRWKRGVRNRILLMC